MTLDLGYDYQYEGEKKGRKKKGEHNKWDEKNNNVPTPYTFRSSFERSAKSKIWPIRRWGGEDNSNP